MRSILDTNVLIADDPAPIEGELAISCVSLAELHFGILHAAAAGERARRLSRYAMIERTFDALPVDEPVAASYGELAAAVAASGTNPRPRSLDLLIAATAHAHNARLVTANLRDFRGVEHLVDVVPLSRKV